MLIFLHFFHNGRAHAFLREKNVTIKAMLHPSPAPLPLHPLYPVPSASPSPDPRVLPLLLIPPTPLSRIVMISPSCHCVIPPTLTIAYRSAAAAGGGWHHLFCPCHHFPEILNTLPDINLWTYVWYLGLSFRQHVFENVLNFEKIHLEVNWIIMCNLQCSKEFYRFLQINSPQWLM